MGDTGAITEMKCSLGVRTKKTIRQEHVSFAGARCVAATLMIMQISLKHANESGDLDKRAPIGRRDAIRWSRVWFDLCGARSGTAEAESAPAGR